MQQAVAVKILSHRNQRLIAPGAQMCYIRVAFANGDPMERNPSL